MSCVLSFETLLFIFFILQTLKRSFFCLFFSVYFISHLFRLYFLRIWIGYTLIFSLIIDFFGPLDHT